MADLKALLGEITPGQWKPDGFRGLSVYMRHEDGVKGRHIADTGRISSQAPRHIVEQDKANARLIALAPELAARVIALDATLRTISEATSLADAQRAAVAALRGE